MQFISLRPTAAFWLLTLNMSATKSCLGVGGQAVKTSFVDILLQTPYLCF